MPEGIAASLTPEQLADLVAYLQSLNPVASDQTALRLNDERSSRHMPGFTCFGWSRVIVLLLAGRGRGPDAAIPAFDPERIFMLGDADLDGRLSLEEYRDFLRSSPRMRTAAAATIEPMFRRLDTDRDGFLSLSEYRKSFPQRPGGAAPGRTLRRRSRRGVDTPDASDHARAGEILRGEDPARAGDAMRQVPREHRRETAGRAPARQPGGLRLGGDSGPAIVPGNPDESLLIQAIRYRDEELRMPPKAKLPDAVVADFEAWVKMGAPTRGPGRRGVAAQSFGRSREGAGVLVVPAAEESPLRRP